MKKSSVKTVAEPIVAMVLFLGLFGYIGHEMGIVNMFRTIMSTAYSQLINTVLYLMAIMVVAGAIGQFLIEFGVIRLLTPVFSIFMRPLFNLPGEAAIAGILTFISDNPAIISLAHDRKFSRAFKQFELVSLTNFGTAFGMGIIVITSMISFGSEEESFFIPAILGLVGALCGAIISTRLMQRLTKKELELETTYLEPDDTIEDVIQLSDENSYLLRLINALLDGGKSGVTLGLEIIPGVLIITTVVLLLSGEVPVGGYTGAANEGVPLLPAIGSLFSVPMEFFFGLEPDLIGFAVTALGSVGAALGLTQGFIDNPNINITGNEIAVFTAIGMCWSGYLSTHTAMLDTLNQRKLTAKAIISHTIGGLGAGVIAHYLFLLYALVI